MARYRNPTNAVPAISMKSSTATPENRCAARLPRRCKRKTIGRVGSLGLALALRHQISAPRAPFPRQGVGFSAPTHRGGPMPLSTEECRRLIDAAHARAGQIGIRVTVAVVDEAGPLPALARMDGP